LSVSLPLDEISILPAPQQVLTGEAIVMLYRLLRQHGRLPYLFWYEEDLPHAERGSWWSFVKWCELNVMVLVMNAARTQLYGACWFSHVVTGHQARMSAAYVRGIDPLLKVAATWKVAQWGFETQGWRQIWAETPWRAAVTHLEHFGAEVLATLPDYCRVGPRATLHPLYIVRILPKG
jgi:hypothetical protein